MGAGAGMVVRRTRAESTRSLALSRPTPRDLAAASPLPYCSSSHSSSSHCSSGLVSRQVLQAAVCVLSNLSFVPENHDKMIELGTLKKLVELIESSDNAAVQEQVAWSIAYLSASESSKQTLIQMGALNPGNRVCCSRR